MSRQRGSITTDLIIYAVIAAAALGAMYACYRWVDGNWQTSAGIAEGKRLATAELQPKLDACQADLGDANTKLDMQSESIASAASAAQASATQARQLAAAAREANAGTQTTIQRLEAAMKAGPGGGECPAGAAAAKLREFLK